MSAWTRPRNCERLVHVKISPPHIERTPTIALNLQEIMEEQAQSVLFPLLRL